jgi:hypothetical protein
MHCGALLRCVDDSECPTQLLTTMRSLAERLLIRPSFDRLRAKETEIAPLWRSSPVCAAVFAAIAGSAQCFAPGSTAQVILAALAPCAMTATIAGRAPGRRAAIVWRGRRASERCASAPPRRGRTACVAGSRPASLRLWRVACRRRNPRAVSCRPRRRSRAPRRDYRLSPIAATMACAVMNLTPGMALRPHRRVGLGYRMASLPERLLSPATLGQTCLRRREVLVIARWSPDV